MQKTSPLFLACSFLFLGVVQAQITDLRSLLAPGATVELLGDGYKFTEGPTPDKNGNVYFTDQPNNTILRWDATSGEISTFAAASGRSNGLYFDKKGNLVACADMDNQLWSWDKNGKHTTLIENYDNKLLNGPNDLWVDKKGGIYFTDPLYKRDYWTRDPAMQQDGQHVYYLSPGGKTLTRVAEDLKQPNGIVGTTNGKTLYVADIGDRKTYVYDIQKDGSLANKKLFVEMGSDGMTLDSQGNVYLTGRSGVMIYDKSGAEIGNIPTGKGWTANVCFGGKDRKTLFITAMDAVYGVKMNVPGAK
ncbi:SMP-30/gluconolactonase/LRE family protein [Imperialibacter roseus]|uniref:SMP-30/gluconolactonase/LRE family protein n=1 Tax=Imperialibacter roseus TaxID=1324217 RepID=A0ABZ0IUW8_9BACT|nr:SMP-30/gluconolactonase/LRE family protein [Imperialibacter roseus]WOK08184.1 SMP-30/gluconolactonase/LRE family protein [Imperialibacter roseus]